MDVFQVGEPHIIVFILQELSLHLQHLYEPNLLQVVANLQQLLLHVILEPIFLEQFQVVRHFFEIVMNFLLLSQIILFV